MESETGEEEIPAFLFQNPHIANNILKLKNVPARKSRPTKNTARRVKQPHRSVHRHRSSSRSKDDVLQLILSEMREMKGKINRLEQHKLDESDDEEADGNDFLEINLMGPIGLVTGSTSIRSTILSNGIKYAKITSLSLEPNQSVRDFLSTVESKFAGWNINSVEYMAIILAILPPEYSLVLRSFDITRASVNSFYKKLVLCSGEGETLAVRKNAFYSTTPEGHTFLSLVGKLESLGSSIFPHQAELNKEVSLMLLSVLPDVYREKLRHFVFSRRVNKGKRSGDFVYPAPLDNSIPLVSNLNEINLYFKKVKHQRINNVCSVPVDEVSAPAGTGHSLPETVAQVIRAFQFSHPPPPVSPFCALCGSIRHAAQNCTIYVDNCVLQYPCPVCSKHFGRDLFHSEESCHTKAFLG